MKSNFLPSSWRLVATT